MQLIQNSKSHLSALAFGDRSTHIDESVYDMRERLKFIVTGLIEYESLIDDKLFRHHSSLLTINGMKIAATASTPIRSKVGKTNKTTLILPLSGQGDLIANGRTLQWRASSKAVFLPNCGGSSESTNRSVLMVDLDPIRLEKVAHTMLGVSPDSISLMNLDIPREIDLQVGRVSCRIFHYSLAPASRVYLHTRPPGISPHAGSQQMRIAFSTCSSGRAAPRVYQPCACCRMQ